MGLVSTEVEVGLNGQTIPYYEKLGYEIPRHLNRNKKLVPIRSAKITVKVSDLSEKSSIKVDAECDKCGKHVKMLYKDYINHNHDEKVYCKYCAYELFMHGSNNPAWKDNKTDEERINGRAYPEYNNFIKRVLARDNYTCQCCGDKNNKHDIEVHHLDGYDWCFDKRTDDTNGITLCSSCHSNFHSIYGYGGNTKKQFEEWLHKSVELLKYDGEIYSTRQVYCIEDDKLYSGVDEIAKELEVSVVYLYKCCKMTNGCHTVKKKHYLYKDIYDSLAKEELDEYLKIKRLKY